MNTYPDPQRGIWFLTAPDGREFRADSPIRCCAKEQANRIPVDVRMKRLVGLLNEEFTESQKVLADYYQVDTIDELIEAQDAQIGRLQKLLPKLKEPGATPRARA